MAEIKKKASRQQISFLLEYIKVNKCMRYEKGNSNTKQNAWLDLTNKLNAMGGTIKDCVGWKKCLTELKCATKKKLRENQILTDQEKTVSKVTGLVPVDDVQDLSEMEEMIIDSDLEKSALEPVPVLAPQLNTFTNSKKSSGNIRTGRVMSMHKRRRRRRGSIILEKISRGAEENRQGLSRIADGLFAIADAINKFTDKI